MTIALILSDLWREGGGAFEALPQAQELPKSPGGIGLTVSLLYVVALYFFCSLALNLHKTQKVLKTMHLFISN